MPYQLPPPLKPGDLLQVVTPSGALRELEVFHKGIEIWRSRGYHLEMSDGWDARDGYLAGSDALRRQQLAAAWHNPECKAILCTRGGYGTARLLENWTWETQNQETGNKEKVESIKIKSHQSQVISQNQEEFEILANSENLSLPSSFLTQNSKLKTQHSKWLIGFSDITNLLWSLYHSGICGVHGPVLTTIAAEPEWSINRLFDLVEGRHLKPLTGVGWGGGKVSGRLLPANLTVATHLLGTPIQPSLEGTILALEDVTEAPYRIDRILTQWRMSGAFKGVCGIALGRFSRCEAPHGIPSWTIAEVLRDRLGDLGIPIISDLPFGHDGVNAALPVGQFVELDGDNGILSWQVSQDS
ncbi:MAG TPA: LD-carboxypeptidase [Cyanobacteria bacterium UBA11149]|nr:LD-carboxypeptidase [Cyanobacteria bacterium UBA11366]HBK64247.1 LD-carboxypeptidase [Cyanobacteria bacterium UBA11166]HBR73325.1 LD-carboxypeptidase [Cyanobacteria bacterium UBA11159]HBS72193.1 LD-carboxypeptidase [Cyanobacteria bacterium UBA11153]HBW89291.1 LD-carboxypeptidase [Cyanobacteria bacterium UBA11149]HCA95608.1 LD-carboxypeptidase [Cyanobacteria bacterium UBA9226]